MFSVSCNFERVVVSESTRAMNFISKFQSAKVSIPILYRYHLSKYENINREI